MFSIERWQEIFETISKNKLRTFLTGVSVASGIFILVLLLGVGQGMENGIAKEFEGDAASSIWVSARTTSVEYNGLNPGRKITMTNEDYDVIKRSGTGYLEYSSSRANSWGVLVNYGKESGSYGIEGIYPDFQMIENQKMIAGRYINANDIRNQNKVAIIGNKIKKELFKKDQKVIGEYIKIKDISFKIVGVYTDNNEREEDRVFIPFSLAQQIFGLGTKIGGLTFSLLPEENFEIAVQKSEEFVASMNSYLKKKHNIAPEDKRAFRINNNLENIKRFYNLNIMIKGFFWWVGICTIIAGIVGVSNIMLIIVKERTKEIGIRKAIGAQPNSIIGLILQEAIFVTTISGFTGLILGLSLLEFVGPLVKTDYILNPSVNFNVAITTVFILIFAGALAGFFPAWRAVRIKPIVALRDE